MAGGRQVIHAEPPRGAKPETEVPTQTFTGFAQMFPWARTGTSQKDPSNTRLPTQNVPYTLILRIILLLSPIRASQAAGRAVQTWANLREPRHIPALRCQGRQQRPSTQQSMPVVVIEDTLRTKDHFSKKLTTKPDQEGMLRKTPKTCVVRMKVSNTANYTREKTLGLSSHPKPPASTSPKNPNLREGSGSRVETVKGGSSLNST